MPDKRKQVEHENALVEYKPAPLYPKATTEKGSRGSIHKILGCVEVATCQYTISGSTITNAELCEVS